MIPFRFLHAADLHLDSRFAGLSHIPDGIRNHLREAPYAALGRLVAVAVEERADFVVISGDVYDAADSSLQSQLRFHEALQALSREKIPVFLIHGNHDPLDSPRLAMDLPEGVTVFGPEAPEPVIARRRSDGREAAVVCGLSYPTAKVTENTALRFRRKEGSGLFHIALHHANVDGDPGHETYAPCTRRDLIQSGFDYWALGHIHKRRILHERPYIVYPGNLQGRSIKETGPKGCYLVDVDDRGAAALRFRELDSVRFWIRDLSIEGLADENGWMDAVEKEVEAVRQANADRMSIVRFRVTGRGPVHRILSGTTSADHLRDELRRREAVRAEQGSVQGLVWTEGFSLATGAGIQQDRLLAEDSFLGELTRLAARLGEDGDSLENFVKEALSPLMENREFRLLLAETGRKDWAAWLARAAESAAALLGGNEEQAGPSGSSDGGGDAKDEGGRYP